MYTDPLFFIRYAGRWFEVFVVAVCDLKFTDTTELRV
jgi:hypothetical protein